MESPDEPNESESARQRSTRHCGQDDQPVGSALWYALLIPLGVCCFYAAAQIADQADTPRPVPTDGMIALIFMIVAWPLLAIFCILLIKGVMNIRGVGSWVVAFLMWLASIAVPLILFSP